MECFNNFWPRRLSAGDSPWIFGGKSSPTPPQYFHDIMENDLRQLLREKAEKHREYYNSIVLNSNAPPLTAPTPTNPSTSSHPSTPSTSNKPNIPTDPSTSNTPSDSSIPSTNYNTPNNSSNSSTPSNPGSPSNSSNLVVSLVQEVKTAPTDGTANSSDPIELVAGSMGEVQVALEVRPAKQRVRRRGVYEFEGVAAETEFKSVKALRDKYLEKLESLGRLGRVEKLEKVESLEKIEDEEEKREFPWDLSERLENLDNLENLESSDKLEDSGKSDKLELLAPPPSSGSGYASGCSDDEKEKFSKSVGGGGGGRSGSSDSAVHSADEDGLISSNWGEKKEEILPDDGYQPRSPYSPRCSVDHTNVPSKTLLEAHYVPLPIDRKFSVDIISERTSKSFDDSRRQSCFSEGEDQQPRYRYWRTPSVVVSDYSDDIMGLTLEDIEYIRESRDRSMSADSSLHSSCSNLNYCGSSLSGLEGDYVMYRPYGRKNSNCSSCSTLSDDDEDGGHHVKKEPSGWRKLRNIVQWTPFFQTYKKQRYPWVQLAGHQGNFKAGPDQGTVLKKLCTKEEKCFKILMKDILRPYVPEYKGLVTSDEGECSYIQLQDLLGDFHSPCVMDCKIGVRTYLEEELAKAKEKPKLRKDMYEKMCQIDQNAPTEEEHKLKGVTKPRYMVWRETISSTATLGFRIEGIRNQDGTFTKDFKTTKTKEQVMTAFEKFTEGFPHAIPKYIQRLKAIKATLETSEFFSTHEVIGSSLLFVHDRFTANVWLIDFAKTIALPQNVKISHNSRWKVGNHEDGYLIGLSNLIRIFMTMLEQQPVTVSPPLALSDPPEVKRTDEET